MKKILKVIGARPQFIKAAAVSTAVVDRLGIEEVIVHTGQHYDPEMSQVFFDELKIPNPKYLLEIGSGSHGAQTGKMLNKLEEVMQNEKPDIVLVYGDTNSTLAGALAAVKLHIPIAHVEAGLRSFNRMMPEEINRILTDKISSLLFCPSGVSISNLEKEGITEGVYESGDVMYDCIKLFLPLAEQYSTISEPLGLVANNYVLATIHRAENTDNEDRLRSIFKALTEISEESRVVLPLHPRTKKYLDQFNIQTGNITLIDPVSYLEMLALSSGAKKIITDSGGLQKEAFWLDVPCITARYETEWIETVEQGWNTLAGADNQLILEAFSRVKPEQTKKDVYGSGDSSAKILNLISEFLT